MNIKTIEKEQIQLKQAIKNDELLVPAAATIVAVLAKDTHVTVDWTDPNSFGANQYCLLMVMSLRLTVIFYHLGLALMSMQFLTSIRCQLV